MKKQLHGLNPSMKKKKKGKLLVLKDNLLVLCSIFINTTQLYPGIL